MRLFKHGKLSFHGLKDIRPSLLPLEKGGVLGMGELLNISRSLEIAKSAIAYDAKDEEASDALSGRFASLVDLPDLRLEINRCILGPEEMADDASSELKRIRRSMKSTNDRVREQLNATMASSASMLRDNIVTMRNGRYCLPVKQEYKSSFQGMIHDQSATGSTFFIEPMAIVKLNNELAELAMKEQEEIEKILISLSALAAPYTKDLERNILLLAELDFIFAKAALSKKMQGSEPLFDQNYIHIKRGRHPLIPRDKVVPIDVTLGKTYDLLIITGPNTGGKTVSLKTVGLFTLMGQAGLHIPAFDRQGKHIPEHSIFFSGKSTQHMFYQIAALRLLSNPDLDPGKLLGACVLNDIFNSVVSSCASLSSHADLSHIQAYIIIDHHQIFYINLVIIHQCTHALST